jgi:argininosuccinate lyase
VLTALRLYEKAAIIKLAGRTGELIREMESFADGSADLPLPGYTHTRKAMPFTVREWMQSFADSLRDDKHMLDSTLVLIDRNPLGTGAGYGVPLPLDRELTTRLLGFGDYIENPMHAHNSRGKLESRILGDCAMILYDLNKWASDLIFFTLPELGYFSLKPAFVTGSSIMPHKQNPDVLELIRAAYHQVSCYEMQLRNIPSNLISGYHRDLQLTKEPLLRGLKTSIDVVNVSIHLMDGIIPNPEKLNAAMTGEMLSVKKVLDLVKSGIPFRDAYRQISAIYKS